MIQITLNPNTTDKVDFENIEHRHLNLLFFFKDLKNFLISSNFLIGNVNHHEEFKKVFSSLPDEVLNACGYAKNKNSFERIDYLVTFVLNKNEIYDLCKTTEYKDLPNVKGLEFLKVI